MTQPEISTHAPSANQAQEAAKAIVSEMTPTTPQASTDAAQETSSQEEVKASAPKPEEPKEPKEQVSQRFAALAKREKAIVEKDKALKAREAQFGDWQKEKETLSQSRREEDELWQTNPLDALKRRGVTYQQLTELVLNNEKPTPDLIARKVAREEVEALSKRQKEEAEAESKRKAQEEKAAAEKEYAETLENFKAETEKYVTANAEKYELIALQGEPGIETVLATIELNFQETSKAGKPRILSFEEACDLVEKHFETEVQKLTATKKFSAKAPPQPQGDTKQVENAKPRTTLNNNMTASTPPPPASKRLSREERIERAMKLQFGR